MGKTKLIAAAALAAFTATGAMAANVSIDQIDAAWQMTDPDSNIPGSGITVDNSGDPVTIRWGDQAEQSGYDFMPETVPFELAEDTPAVLGTFTHLNNPISGPTLNSAQLNFSFGGSVLDDGQGNMFPPGLVSATFGAIFDFTHNETPNNSNNCPGDLVACDDVVTVSAQGGASETIQVLDTLFTFTLLGFSNDGVNFSDTFITTEGLSNSSDLYFDYSVAVVPLPAAGWMLLAGLGALGAVGRRRRKAA